MSQSQKSSPNTYVVVSRLSSTDPAAGNPYGYMLLGVFTDPAAIGPYLTANSSGNQPFAGEEDVASLAVGETNRSTFGEVTIYVTALRTDGRTKTIYVLFNGRAQTTKPVDVHAPLVLRRHADGWSTEPQQ
jgi:hypothetical protein